jgi:hypothetical protein
MSRPALPSDFVSSPFTFEVIIRKLSQALFSERIYTFQRNLSIIGSSLGQEETNKVAMKKSKLESADILPLYAPSQK